MTAKKKIILAIVALVSALTFCEGAARLLEFTSKSAKPGFFNGALIDRSLLQKDWQMGWVNVPRAEGLMIHSFDGSPNRVVPLAWDLSSLAGKRYHKSYFRINSLGNRGEEMSPDKAAGLMRVVFAGDSVTFGYYVSAEETFIEQTRLSLLQAAPTKPFEFINAGVSSLGCAEIFSHIKNRITGWNPDLVVWVFYLNDLNDDERTHLFPDRRLGVLSRYSALGRLLQKAVRERKIAERWPIDKEFEQIIEADWEKASSALVAAKRWVESGQSKLAVLCVPSGYQLDKPWTKKNYQEKLRAICREKQIDFIDATPFLESKGQPEGLYFKGDWIHPNKKGHQAISEALLAYFQDKYLNA